jgi:F0F1-type ATP synthase membrane subunit c/vacuolar-type H+-ATPase subunit K
MSLPSPGRRRAVTLLAILPWTLLLFEFLLIVPRYKKVFDEFGLKVAGLVEGIFLVSGWVQRHVVVAVLLTLLLTAISVGLAHAVQIIPVSRTRRLFVLFLVFAVPCLLFLLAWLGMFWTDRKLAEGLQR